MTGMPVLYDNPVRWAPTAWSTPWPPLRNTADHASSSISARRSPSTRFGTRRYWAGPLRRAGHLLGGLVPPRRPPQPVDIREPAGIIARTPPAACSRPLLRIRGLVMALSSAWCRPSALRQGNCHAPGALDFRGSKFHPVIDDNLTLEGCASFGNATAAYNQLRHGWKNPPQRRREHREKQHVLSVCSVTLWLIPGSGCPSLLIRAVVSR